MKNAPGYPLDIKQGTSEWHAWRLGKPTASMFKNIITPEGKPSKADFRWKLLAERIFKVSFQPDIGGKASVAWGRYWENTAREKLAERLKADIEPGGIWADVNKRYGASPDGFVNGEPVEIKCPEPPQQLESMLTQDKDYIPQLQGQMLLTGADRAHFWSWSPFAPPGYHVIERNEEYCTKLSRFLIQFCDDLDRDESKLLAMGYFDVEACQEWKKKGVL